MRENNVASGCSLSQTHGTKGIFSNAAMSLGRRRQTLSICSAVYQLLVCYDDPAHGAAAARAALDAAAMRSGITAAVLQQWPSFCPALEGTLAGYFQAGPALALSSAATAAGGAMELLTLNVCGMRSSSQYCADLLLSRRPVAAVFTETKLRTRHHNQPWVQACMTAYKKFASSTPDNRLAGQRAQQGAHQLHGRAGVLIAVREDFASAVCHHSIPSALQGHLVHVSLCPPGSQPLELIGVYQPNHDQWQGIMKDIFACAGSQMRKPRGTSSRLLFAGDWNATSSPCDRGSANVGHSNTMDRKFRQLMTNHKFCSLFRGDPHRPCSFIQRTTSPGAASSRIDDFLTLTDGPLLESASQIRQPQVLHDEECTSDHMPVIAKFPSGSLFATEPRAAPEPQPRAASLIRPVAKDDLAEYRATLEADMGLDTDVQTAALLATLRKQDISDDEFDAQFAALDSVLGKAADIAYFSLPTTCMCTAPRPQQHGLRFYLPRSKKRDYLRHMALSKKHHAAAQACRSSAIRRLVGRPQD